MPISNAIFSAFWPQLIPISVGERRSHELRHHPPPRYHLRLGPRPRLLLVRNQRPQQTIQVLVRAIVQFLELLEASAQIRADLGRVVVSQPRGVGAVAMLVVVGETCDLLYNISFDFWRDIQS